MRPFMFSNLAAPVACGWPMLRAASVPAGFMVFIPGFEGGVLEPIEGLGLPNAGVLAVDSPSR